jgi:signal transduction histidine kinase
LKIRIFAERTETEDLAVVEIVDSGPGVAAAMREQIFNPFVSTKKTGVGLGLAIVSKIVDAHGGRVTLGESSPAVGKQGACFRVSFPAVKYE